MGKGLLVVATIVAVAGLAVAAAGNATSSLIAYLVTLVLGTACLAGYRPHSAAPSG